MKNEFYELLMVIGSDRVAECNLKKYPKELIKSALENGYIMRCGKNYWGDQLYAITEKGRTKRDN